MRVITAEGEMIALGETEASPTIGIVDFSRRETDEFGVTRVVERGFSRRMAVRLALPFDTVDAVQRRVAELRATAATWVADDDIEWLQVEGFYRDFQLDLAVPPTSFCTLSIEGTVKSEPAPDPGGDPAPAGSTSTLRLLQPVAISEVMLAASSIAETDAPAWSPVTTYAAAATVVRGHRVFESLIAGNVGKDPLTEPGAWLDTGPTNRWAMFDEALGTATTGPGAIVVTIAAGAVNAVALLDVVGTSVQVEAGAYDRTVTVGSGPITFLDLPTSTAPVKITVQGGGTVKVGTLLIGKVVDLGTTEASPAAGIADFSRKDVDDFGEVTIVKRAWAKTMSARALLRTDAVDMVANRIAAVRARPSLWIADEGTDSLTVYGFFKDFGIEVGDNVSLLTLQIEGLSDAGKVAPLSVAWPNVTDPEGTRPEDNATDGATVGDNVKDPDGAVLDPGDILNDAVQLLPSGRLQRQLGAEIVPMGAIEPRAMEVQTEAAARQLERALAAIHAALISVGVEAQRTRDVFMDAGISIDPTTGKARIYAVEQQAQTLSEVAITLAAQQAQITLAATRTYVNEQIAAAVIDPSQVAEFEEIIARLASAEVTISALTASVALKADATTVSTLSTALTTVSTALDALTGTVELKANASVVTALGARVESVELVLGAIGDTASIVSAVSRASYRRADAEHAWNTIADRLATEDAKSFILQALATARSELYAKTVEGDAVEAGARLQLAAQFASTTQTLMALYAAEQLARSTGDQASVTAITNLTARLNAAGGTGVTVEAALANALSAIVTVDEARVEDRAQLTARLNGAGGPGVTVEQALIANASAINGVLAQYFVKISGTDGSGNPIIAGFGLGVDGETSEFAILATMIRVGTGLLVFDSGEHMKVLGVGFGAAGNLIEWSGPTMPITECTTANCRACETIDGDIITSGTFITGPYENAKATTSPDADASVTIGPFLTRGLTKTINVGYLYQRGGYNADYGEGSAGGISANIAIDRRIDGGAWSLAINSFVASGTTSWTSAVPGDFGSYGSYEQQISGSLTFSDPTTTSGLYEYRARIVSRTTTLPTASGFTPDPPGLPPVAAQSLSIITKE